MTGNNFKIRQRKYFIEITKNNYSVFILLVLVIIFSVLHCRFLSWPNLSNIFWQNAHMFVLMIGISFIMIGGGVDLSVGYQISLVSVVTGYFLSHGIGTGLTILLGLLVGVACGIINGMIISKFKIAPLVATIMTQVLFCGVSYMISNGITYFGISSSFRALFETEFLLIPMSIWIGIVCIVFSIFVFSRTVYGKYLRVLGTDEELLINNNVNVQQVKMISYIWGSFFVAISAFIIVSKQAAANSSTGVGFEITGIMAAYIGGFSNNVMIDKKRTRKITPINFIIGMIILAVIENGMYFVGESQYKRYCINVLVLIVSLVLNLKFSK